MVKNGSEIGQKMVKFKNAHRNAIYACNFWHIYKFIYTHMIIYRNLTPNITKGQKTGQKGSKIGKKMAKIIIAHRNTIFS